MSRSSGAALKQLGTKLLGESAAKSSRYWMARGKEALGIRHYPALNDLDRKVIAILGSEPGFFVEAGANDGLNQSNTWALERYCGWSGILVEPVPALAFLCGRFRRAPCVNAALGAFVDEGQTIELYVAGLMTVAADTNPAALGRAASEHARVGAEFVGGLPRKATATVRALSNLLDERGIAAVDLLSLDVEGYEKNVLAGIDFQRHAIRNILVETRQIGDIVSLLDPWFPDFTQLSQHDYLFRAAWPSGRSRF